LCLVAIDTLDRNKPSYTISVEVDVKPPTAFLGRFMSVAYSMVFLEGGKVGLLFVTEIKP